MPIEDKESVYEYRKIGDQREIDILDQKRKQRGSEDIGKGGIEDSLDGEWSVNEEVLPSDQPNDLDLVTIEKYEISDAVVDDNEHSEYEESDDTIDTIVDGQENIYEALYALILGTIIGQRFLGALFIVLDDTGVTFDNRIDIGVFPEGDIFDDDRRGERILFVSLYDPRELRITFLEHLQRLFAGDELHLYRGACLLEGRYALDDFRVVLRISRLEIQRYAHAVIDIRRDR